MMFSRTSGFVSFSPKWSITHRDECCLMFFGGFFVIIYSLLLSIICIDNLIKFSAHSIRMVFGVT